MKPVKAWAVVLDDGRLLQELYNEIALWSKRKTAEDWRKQTKGKAVVRVEIREVKPKKGKA